MHSRLQTHCRPCSHLNDIKKKKNTRDGARENQRPAREHIVIPKMEPLRLQQLQLYDSAPVHDVQLEDFERGAVDRMEGG